jgi:hypothetical protein
MPYRIHAEVSQSARHTTKIGQFLSLLFSFGVQGDPLAFPIVN